MWVFVLFGLVALFRYLFQKNKTRLWRSYSRSKKLPNFSILISLQNLPEPLFMQNISSQHFPVARMVFQNLNYLMSTLMRWGKKKIIRMAVWKVLAVNKENLKNVEWIVWNQKKYLPQRGLIQTIYSKTQQVLTVSYKFIIMGFS